MIRLLKFRMPLEMYIFLYLLPTLTKRAFTADFICIWEAKNIPGHICFIVMGVAVQSQHFLLFLAPPPPTPFHQRVGRIPKSSSG